MKRGRKQRHFITSWGEIIVGLSRRPDGRWRIIGSHTNFTEPDERKAIEKFRELTGAKRYRYVPILPFDPAAKRLSGEPTSFAIREEDVWHWLAQQIRERPKYAAEKTGIEQLGYLSDLRPPTPLPSFGELETAWTTHFKGSAEQRRKVLAAWDDFKATSKVSGLRDINSQTVIAFRDQVYARNLSGKSQRNLFTRIRRLVSFSRGRGVSVAELSEVGNYLALLVPSETSVSLDPQPIEPKDFRTLLDKAEGDDRAMVLLMLNAAMYLQEVIRLKWDDFKGDVLVTHRRKTGKCVRVALLWPETVEALGKVKKLGEYVFYSYAGSPLGIKGADKRFRLLRERAGVDVTASQLRDGAYTAAVEANVTSNLCQLLVGHRSGIADHYVKRSPKMVAPACTAIRAKYLP